MAVFAGYKDVTVVRQAVAEEMDGPGKLLGYRAMQKRIRQEHELNVTRDMVHAAMQCVIYDLDPEGLEARSVGSKKRKPKGHFTTKGPNFVHSVDGHDEVYDVMRRCLRLASPSLFHSRLEVFPLGSHFADYRSNLYQFPLFIQSHLCTVCWDTMAVIGHGHFNFILFFN